MANRGTGTGSGSALQPAPQGRREFSSPSPQLGMEKKEPAQREDEVQLHPLDDRGDAHAAADAEGDQGSFLVTPLQFIQRRAQQARAGGPSG